MDELDAPTIKQVTDAPAGIYRAGYAAVLYRHAEAAAEASRARRDAALVTLSRVQHMRPSDIERATGVPPSLTNYAKTRMGDTEPVEQPVETVNAAVADVDRWETLAEEARTIRDEQIRQLAASGEWSVRDLAELTGLTRSRISQIVGTPETAFQPGGSRTTLRFATLTELAQELRRRARIVAVLDCAAGEVLTEAAKLMDDVARRQA